jgi:hypothetical protein
MKLSPLICIMWLITCCPSWARDQEKRFLEFPNDTDTVTVDLNTVQIIQPGRFTVIETTIDNPDMMRFELKVLATLRTYCARAVGQYPAPTDLLMLGPPDMPVKNIEVSRKMVVWYYPYKRLQGGAGGLDCRSGNRTEQDLYSEAWDVITKGIRVKGFMIANEGFRVGPYTRTTIPRRPLWVRRRCRRWHSSIISPYVGPSRMKRRTNPKNEIKATT